MPVIDASIGKRFPMIEFVTTRKSVIHLNRENKLLASPRPVKGCVDGTPPNARPVARD